MKPDYKFTIIIPVYNELANLNKLTAHLDNYQKFTPVKTKVLFIDDGSVDGSTEHLLKICKDRKRFNVKILQQNYGLSTALKSGIDSCNTDWVGYIDADLQTLPQDFMQCFKYMDNYQMVTGIRESRKDSGVKKIASKVANRFRRLLIKDDIKDTCCPLKIMDTKCAKALPFFKGMHRFLPALILLHGGKVKEFPIQHFARYAGQSKYHIFNRLFNPFIDTLAFIWLKRRHINYEFSKVSGYKKVIKEHSLVND